MFTYRPDSRWGKVIEWAGSAIILNLLWLACCVPVVTVGPATAALYDATRRHLLGGEGYLAATFFRAARDNLKQAGILGVIALAIGGVAGMSALAGLPSSRLAVGAAVLVGGLFVVCVLFWCVPLAARFHNTVPAHLRHGVILGLTHLGSTLALLAGIAGIVVAVMRFLPFVFVLPVALMTAWTWQLERLFRKYGYVPVPAKDAPSAPVPGS